MSFKIGDLIACSDDGIDSGIWVIHSFHTIDGEDFLVVSDTGYCDRCISGTRIVYKELSTPIENVISDLEKEPKKIREFIKNFSTQ